MLKHWQATIGMGQHEPRFSRPLTSAKLIRLITLTNPFSKGGENSDQLLVNTYKDYELFTVTPCAK